MQEISNFIVNNWKFVITLVAIVVSFILQMLSKKPVKTIDTLKETICSIVPKAINLAEKGVSFDNTSDKKTVARRLVLTYLHEKGYDDEIILEHTSFVDDFIELVLSTPQKKDGK